MVSITPFRALRPRAESAAEIASVPYDVVDRDEATLAARDRSYCLLRITRSEIELPGTDPYAEKVYNHARENLKRWIAQGALFREELPSLYVYRLQNGAHVQLGLAARFSTEDYAAGRIKKHELTRKDKEDDRTRHIDTTGAQTGPVLLFHKDKASTRIREILHEAAGSNPPLYDVTAQDAVRHTIFRITEKRTEAELVELFSALDAVYIADGHHRAASAARVAEKRGQSSGMLAVCFPDTELKILSYNRAISDLNGLVPDEFRGKVQASFEIREKKGPPARGEFGLFLDGRWVLLRAKPALTAGADEIMRLDVSILQTHLLAPVLDIDDPRTSPRIQFVGGIRGEPELEKLVQSGKFAVSFSLHPVSTDELIAVADADRIMPPKSTWFEPKLRDGFLINLLD